MNDDNASNVVSIDMAEVVIERDALMSTLGAVPAGHPHAFRFPTSHDAVAAASLISTMCPRLRAEQTSEPATIRVAVTTPTGRLVVARA